jgi:hypothetical protein
MASKSKKMTIKYWNGLSRGSRERALKYCYPIHGAIVEMLLDEKPTTKEIKDGWWTTVFKKVRIPDDNRVYKTVIDNRTYLP